MALLAPSELFLFFPSSWIDDVFLLEFEIRCHCFINLSLEEEEEEEEEECFAPIKGSPWASFSPLDVQEEAS